MKHCKSCNAEKEASAFYAGVSSRCKECHKAAVRENRNEKAEYYRQYDKMRFQRDDHRKADNRARAKTPKGMASTAASRAKWLAQNPEKRAAQIILNNAVRDGRAVKPELCEQCGDRPLRRLLHAHHHDYALPLDVNWFCNKCHALEHFGPAPAPPEKNKSRGRHVKRIAK